MLTKETKQLLYNIWLVISVVYIIGITIIHTIGTIELNINWIICTIIGCINLLGCVITGILCD